MKTVFIIILSFILFLKSNGQNADIQVYSFDEFSPVLHKQNDTLYIINFWATWCKPCIQELPCFEKINMKYKNAGVKVILVSLDFFDELNTRLIPFINRKGIKSEVIMLNESDPNTFIDKISTKWSGAIPATYIYTNNSKEFYEQSFTCSELDSIVNQKLNINEK